MSESASYVYAYFRLDGETPCYIGKGKGERLLHKSKAGGRNPHFIRLIQQARALGKELRRVKLLEGLTDQEACQIEADLIRLIGREAYGGPLVNLTDGGDGPCGYKWTEEQSAAASKRRQGRKLSPEHRSAISAGLKGKPKSPEHVMAAAAGQRGGTKQSGWWSTLEGRAKQRASRKGPSPEQLAKRDAGLAAYRAKRKAAILGIEKGS